jgi:N-acetylmuramoyl-L-alanine amidase
VQTAFSPDSPLTDIVVPSPNFGLRKDGKRPDCIVLHYTGMPTAEGAVAWLANPDSQVSAHYVIREDGAIIQMVAEAARAWHAGKGVWQGETDINSVSIGVEICNPGHPNSDPKEPYPDFPDHQLQSVFALTRNIVRRHRLNARRVLAHSDIAPRRKIDPGENFPWATLWTRGMGLYVEPSAIKSGKKLQVGDRGPDVMASKGLFAKLGFGIDDNDEFDTAFEFVIKAFQRHWRPERIDGVLDRSSLETLQRLLTMQVGLRQPNSDMRG